AKQAAVADYYRQFHLYFVKGEAGSELTTTDQIDEEFAALQWEGNFWKKIFMFFYRHYTANQEVLTPQMQQLRRCMKSRFGETPPVDFREKFRASSKPLMKYTNILTFNTRSIALFIAVLVGCPIAYFVFELTILNLLLVYMMRRHENICCKYKKQLQ
ncbi:MAG: CDP-alcohol phosphatidyltransferase family protein, partial [Muribaculaceae bacterium]|nr:CDP-alcohol phosphatidyltransferase family protein [Muribaculaceae bacterium]